MANPIAAWSFDDGSGTTIVDDTGNGHTLTRGSASFTASGHSGAALANTSNSSTTGASATMPTVSGSACTLMAWVKPSALPSNGTHLIAGVLDTGGTDFALWSQRSTFGTPNVLQGNARLGGGVVPIDGTALTVGTWVHVAMTYDGFTLKLWRNGTAIATAANTNTINNTRVFAVAGQSGNGTAAVTVDDVRYFNTDESANITTWMNTPTRAAATSGIKIYNGTSWVDSGMPKLFSGSAWVTAAKARVL